MTYLTKQVNLIKFLVQVTAALIMTLLATSEILAVGPETILVNVDPSGHSVGRYNSVAINHRGNAVISYYDYDDGGLKVAVCNDSACSDPAITLLDNSFLGSGLDTSVVINSKGYPVISYADIWNFDLHLVVCEDVKCDQFASYIVDGTGDVDVGLFNSMVLDSSDHPIIVYHESDNYSCCINKLRLAVCSDTICSSPDIIPLDFDNDSGTVTHETSIALNSSGNPVIAYTSNYELKLVVCKNVTCTDFHPPRIFGSITAASWFSMALNSNDIPIIAYHGAGVKLDVCSDTTCSSSTPTNIDNPISGSDVSMVLNSSGYPIISYTGDGDVRQIVCPDVTCLDQIPTIVDSSDVSYFSYISMALDNSGHPVISYQAGGNTLKLAICPICTTPARTTVDNNGNVGRHTSVVLNSNGHPVISYRDETNNSLKLAICDNFDCSNPTLTTVDDTANVGNHTSLALNSNDEAVISYRDFSNTRLKLAVCNNATTCANPTLTTVDNTTNVGTHTSLVLNSSGYPVISYRNANNATLKLAVCYDATCTTSPTLRTVDSTGDVGRHTSLALDSDGYPIISYRDVGNQNLKLAICHDATCTSPSPTLRIVDDTANVGAYSVLALNSSGSPVISYYDSDNNDLKLAVCHDATCTSRDLTTVDDGGDSDDDVGRHLFMRLSSNNLPLISYRDATNGDLKLAVCNDPACTTPTITVVDPVDDMGQFTAMVLDSLNFPVISYYDVTNEHLRLASYSADYSFAHLPIVVK